MTTEEIKQNLSMRDVLETYNVKVNNSGMCCCPIHNERHPSMKVYEDSFNCFACGSNGDIFKFVQLMDECDFKTAFYKLGGTYKKNKSFSDLRKIDKSKRVVKHKQKQYLESVERLKYINKYIDVLQFNLDYLQEGCPEWHSTLMELEQSLEEQFSLLEGVKKYGYFST